MVGYGYIVAKPSGDHLSPRGVRLAVLVNDGRVAAEIDGTHAIGGWLDLDRGDGGVLAVEFKCEAVVPVKVVVFTWFESNVHLLVDISRAFVYHEGEGLQFLFLRLAVFYHAAS